MSNTAPHLIKIRAINLKDKVGFLQAMQDSQALHYPWVSVPLSTREFDIYLAKSQLPNQKSFLIETQFNQIVGVFNINEIVQGAFQSGYLGFYAVIGYARQGYMSAGLKLLLKYAFEVMKLHRLEANIQPENSPSVQLVKNNGFRYEGFSPRYLKINGEWRGHERWAVTAEDYLSTTSTIKEDPIEIEPYNPLWPLSAQHEIDKIRTIFPINSIIDIQHVGSTAIVGLAAKPILDIQIAVQSIEHIKIIAIPLLQKLGYEFWADNPDSTRLFFVKGMPPYGKMRSHHVHISEQDSQQWRDKLIFRDYLKQNPNFAKEYEHLKITLAHQHKYNRELYTESKSDFIKKILQLARN